MASNPTLTSDSAPEANTAGVLALERICLDFRLRQDRYLDPLTRFLRDHEEELELLERDEDPVQAYLKRVWPEDLPGALIVANISRLRHSLWLIRPPVSGPQAGTFAARGLVPAFRVYRRQGALVVVGMEIVPHARPRPFEVLVTGTVRIQQPDAMSAQDMDAMEAIPRHGQQMETHLAAWRRYLDWKEKLIHLGQVVLNYDRIERDAEGNLRFHIRYRPSGTKQLNEMQGMLVLAAPLSASQSRHQWVPTPGKRPQITRIGAMLRVHSAGEAHSLARVGDRTIAGDHQSPPEQRAELVVAPGEHWAGEQSGPAFPQAGFLLFNIGGEIRPVHQERTGIERLCSRRGHNPYLLDWLFNSRHAAVPDLVADAAAALPAAAKVNPDQREAINKGLAAPDCCPIQGPPGTGKTWVIVWICYLVASAGGRVLVSSQTNLAVDNVLARLPDSPQIRPVRIAKAERVDEAFHGLLDDRAAGGWLARVARHCRERVQQLQATQETIRTAERAFEILRQILEQADQLRVRMSELEDRRGELSRQRQTLLAARNEVQRQAEETVRQYQTFRELIEWLQLPHDHIPALAPQAVSAVSTALGQFSTRIEASIAALPWPLPGARNATTSPSDLLARIHLLQSAVTSAGGLQATLAEGTALCRGAVGAAHSATSHRLRELLTQRSRLSQSEREADLLAIAEINRELKTLRQDRWSDLCRAMLEAFQVIFDHQVPADLDELASSLQPHAGQADLLSRLGGFCSQLREDLGPILTHGMSQLTEAATAGKAQTLDRQKAVQAQDTQLQRQIDELEAPFDEVHTRLERDGHQLSQYQARWAEVWPQAWVDSHPDEPVPAIHREPLTARRQAYDAWYAERAAELERRARWRVIQEEWVHRLTNPVEAERERVQAQYLRHANIVGMTCYEAGQRDFHDDPGFRPFDVVIIDEASKVTPPEFLLAALLGRKVIPVGDHLQLRPMFRENESSYEEAAAEGLIAAEDFHQHRNLVTASYFEQLYEAAPPALRHTLYVQYRLHSQIMAVSNLFYEGRLVAGPSDQELDQQRQHHLRIRDSRGGWLIEPHHHLLWVDSTRDRCGRQVWERQQGTSKINPLEADLTVAMLLRIHHALREQGYGPQKRKSVGVITFYAAQLREIRWRLDQLLSREPDALSAIDLRTNTVDRFQGMERSIVLVNLVRAVPRMHGGEFVKQYQRINVAFSRAQELLVIIGSERTFRNAVIDLPSAGNGPPRQAAIYRDIYELVTRYGGRRYANQIL